MSHRVKPVRVRPAGKTSWSSSSSSIRGAVSEVLERRRLLALTPTFAAAKVVPYALDKPVVDYAFGRFNGDAALDLTALSSTYQNFNYQYQRDDAYGNNVGGFAQRARQTAVGTTGAQIREYEYQTGDFNGDGKVDLFAANRELGFGGNSTNSYIAYVYPGDGTGAFAANPKGNGARYDGVVTSAFTVADVTGDGKSDVIFAGNIGVQVDSDLNGSGNFDTAYSANPIGGVLPMINAVDVTGDAKRDLIFAVETPTHEYLYDTPKTANTFGAPTIAADLAGRPMQQRFGDFNGDGKVDVAILEVARADTNYTATTAQVEILLGTGDGRFGRAGVYALHGNPGGLTVADFDGDGRPDVAVGLRGRVAAATSSVALLGNSGNGAFDLRYVAGLTDAYAQLDSGDFNGDGKPDLIVNDRSTGKLLLCLNNSLKPAIVTGTVFNDLNADGAKGTGETGLAARTVWADDDNDGVLDAGESFATTAADGTYRLPIGQTTSVRERLPVGWSETPGYNGGVSTARPVTYVAGVASTINFSQKFRGAISGRVFADNNANASYDFNVTINGITYFEGGIAGRTLYLDKNANSKLDAGEPSTTSDASGIYGFDVPAGTYNVRDVAIAGELNTTGTVRVVTFAAGASAYNVNFGHTKPGGIAGTVYDDAGQLGAYVAGDALLGGVRVFIDKNGDGVYQSGEPTALTDANGKYAIANQFPGNVRVRVVLPKAGYVVTAPAAGYFDTRIVGGSAGSGVDFGLIYAAYVGGRVFADNDANGAIASYEKGVAGFGVFVDYNANGTPDKGEPLVLSDASGNYALRSSKAGNFKVVVRKLAGYNSTVPSTSRRTVSLVQGATVAGQNFGVIKGAFSTAPYKPPLNIPTTSNPTSLAAGDFNKDGNADFIVAGDNSLGQVFLGLGNGSFTHNAAKDFAIGGATRYMVAADVSGDGKIDLIAADQDDDTGTPNVYGGIAVLLGNGDGTFKPAVHYSAGAGTYGVAVADFTGDGKPDLVAANSAGATASVLINNGNGTFKPPAQVTVPYGATSVAAGDVNKDGRADFVLASASDDSIVVVTGKGNGTFNSPVRQMTGANGPTFVTLADLNADAKLDVIFVNPDANDLVVRLGNGNATFGNAAVYATADFPQQVAVVDVDKDGALDLVASCRSDGTADISGGVSVLRGRGDGTFADYKIATAHTSPTAVAVADFNGDGRLDLLAANIFSDDVSLLLNSIA